MTYQLYTTCPHDGLPLSLIAEAATVADLAAPKREFLADMAAMGIAPHPIRIFEAPEVDALFAAELAA